MNYLKNPIPNKSSSYVTTFFSKKIQKLPSLGYGILVFIMLAIASVMSINFSQELPLLLEGEYAPMDIVAERSFLFEDRDATELRKKEIRDAIPIICDLLLAPITVFEQEMQATLNKALAAKSLGTEERLAQDLSEKMNTEVSVADIDFLAEPETQSFILTELLPDISKRLHEGILPDVRMVLPYKEGGMIARVQDSGEEHVRADISSIADLKLLESHIAKRIKDLPFTGPQKRIVGLLLSKELRPTLIPNYTSTNLRAQSLEKSARPILRVVQKGETIVKQGKKITKEQQVKLQALILKQEKEFDLSYFIGISLFAITLSACFFLYPQGKSGFTINTRDFLFISLLLVIVCFIAKSLFLLGHKIVHISLLSAPDSLGYAVPLVGAAIIAAQVFPLLIAGTISLIFAFFSTAICEGGIGLFLYYFLSSLLAAYLTSSANSRKSSLKRLVPLGLGVYLLWIASTLIDGGTQDRFSVEALSVFISIFLSIILVAGLTPILEYIFGFTTRFRLMELLNLEQAILKELMLNAPGTYHHSLIVSNLVEAAAESVGANSLLCKVAALYHDIGKISKANYFIENQFHEENPHDKLNPSMSALILISHVKQGAELAKKYRLGREIADIICQHHGTGVIRYFYQKALQNQDAPAPQVEDFSYPGPKPQSKEAGIVMLADIIEASSRTLSEPSSSRLRTHIDTIIKNVFADGQLDETDLTLSDLTTITETFLKVLLGIFHHRIAYPEREKKD